MNSISRRGKWLVFFVLACTVALPAVHALAPKDKIPPKPTTAVATRTAPKPLLWKVSDENNAIYLLGSFHVLKTDDYPLSGDVDKAFDDAERLVFEVAPEELTDPSLALRMQALAGYSDGRSLSQVLPADLHARMAQVLGDERAAQLEMVEPWFINLSLLIGVSQQMGFRADQGLDLHLAGRAAAAGKPAVGLETAAEQLQVLDSTPMEEQVAGLRDFFENPGELPRLLDETHSAWRNADTGTLEAVAIEQFRKETPETYRLINVERNNAWLPKLREMLDAPGNDDTLVVVGAMHLVGEDGVVDKLRAAGYTVERICSACAAR